MVKDLFLLLEKMSSFEFRKKYPNNDKAYQALSNLLSKLDKEYPDLPSFSDLQKIKVGTFHSVVDGVSTYVSKDEKGNLEYNDEIADGHSIVVKINNGLLYIFIG